MAAPGAPHFEHGALRVFETGEVAVVKTGADRKGATGMSTGTLPLYMVTIFLSAFLLFAVQPMFTKMALPRAGGSPAVWNTSMVFFQAVLLAGYLYAHLSTHILGLKRQTILHALVLLAAFLFLPIGLEADTTPPASASPIPWLLGVLAVSVGIPFFAISATAPLLQKWFANTDHAYSGDPYFLYGASNLGSWLALLSYPVIVEPLLGVRAQSVVWMLGYAALVALIFACAVLLWRRYRPEIAAATTEALENFVTREVTWPVRGRWVLLSLVPSALLLGATLHIGSYIAAVPFLWIIPLSLYLLTFVFVFARRPLIPPKFWMWAQLITVPMVAIFFETSQIYVLLVLHLAAMFASTMVLHGELARLRPPPAKLTEFYLWMSVGGVLGGILSAIVAPLIFDSVYEYPIALLLAMLLRPRATQASRVGTWLANVRPIAFVRDSLRSNAAGRALTQPVLLDFLLPALLYLIIAENRLRQSLMNSAFVVWGWIYAAFGRFMGDYAIMATTLENTGKVAYTLVVLLALILLGARRPLRLALAMFVVLIVLTPGLFWKTGDQLARIRSFFGVTTIYVNRVDTTPGPLTSSTSRFHYLVHGVTIHGVQFMDVPRLPVSYYTERGPVGHFFASIRPTMESPALRVGVLGLGAGALACYMRPQDQLTFYEIDPVVEQVARDPDYFRFLQECGSDVLLGDGRLTVAKEPDASFDVIFLDAFSGDGIPVHILTREAIQLYFRKLKPGGKLMVHITNTFVNLLPVVADLAKDANLAALTVDYSPSPATFFALPTTWVVLARRPQDIAVLKEGYLPWGEIPPVKPVRTWTDDFSNVFSALKWDSLGLFPKGVEAITNIKVEVAPAEPAPAAPTP
jgi:hypothetical protein